MTDRPLIRVHHAKQPWLKSPRNRRWQRRPRFYWPCGRKWRGIGFAVWAHEFSVRFGPKTLGGFDD